MSLEVEEFCSVCKKKYRRNVMFPVPPQMCAMCFSEKQLEEAVMQKPDPGAHYRREIRKPITDEDIARGYVIVKVDPYRTCQVYGIQGGPHEHTTKKLLRGEAKGHDARELIAEVRCCLDRWEEMLDEDEGEARCK